MPEGIWFYHVAYQHPIATATGHALGYAYGDTTYDADSRIDTDDKMWDLRNELGRIADRHHDNDRGVRRSGPPVITSITLLASPEEADHG